MNNTLYIGIWMNLLLFKEDLSKIKSISFGGLPTKFMKMKGDFGNILMMAGGDGHISFIDTNDNTEYHQMQLECQPTIRDIIKTKKKGDFALGTVKGLRFS